MNIPFKPRELDIAFTSGRDPVSCYFNRTAAAGWSRRRDYTVCTHVLFMTLDHGQWMATEMQLRGIVEGSFDKYLVGRKSKLHSVYRWDGFDDPEVRARVLAHLAYLRQQKKRYDLRGAILRNRVVRFLFPFIKENKETEYCSENITRILIWQGWQGYPPHWKTDEPHPYPLYLNMSMDTSFRLVYENTKL